MTTSIKDLPPPYPNQALARSKQFSEVKVQEIVREKAEKAQETAPTQSGGPSSGDASSTGTDQHGGGKSLGFSLYA
jgi:hypothetical protein